MSTGPAVSAAVTSGEKASNKRSPEELIKENSGHLRGTVALELVEQTDHFNEQNKQLLKFHGTYQQDDRDARKQRSKESVGKHYMFMVRCKIPGGRVTAEQYLTLDRLAGTYANGTLRITSRQGIQFHGVLKSHLKETIAGINECLLTTLGACGDVERNVMASPSPIASPLFRQIQDTADLLARRLAPRTRAYHEIWLNGRVVSGEIPSHQSPLNTHRSLTTTATHDSPQSNGEAEAEPLYGQVYLPRKFKTGLALPEDNSIDLYAQDLGLLGVVENERIAGYNVLVGGGMGMTHGNAGTFPFLARPICYVLVDKVVALAEAVIRLFRDHGNRGDRKRARIKYLVHDWGVEKFRQILSGYVDFPLELPRPVEVTDVPLHLGWHAQGDGKYYYGISVENGRIKDEGSLRLRSCLRALVERHRPQVRFTPVQDILLCDLASGARADIERTLTDHGVRRPEQISSVQKHSMACPAVPTCGLAITESERVLPGIVDQLELELERFGLTDLKITVRMTGCPNGCARPYQSDIGLVGRSGDKFTVFLGGNILGNRLNFPFRDLVPQNQIVALVVPLLEAFKRERVNGEGFGDYCCRLGAERLQKMVPAEVGKAIGH
jgi:sulfite reductase (ferredoxin)